MCLVLIIMRAMVIYKNMKFFFSEPFQTKYKKGKEDLSSSLYSTLPETLDTLHAKEAAQLQSQVTRLQTFTLNSSVFQCVKKEKVDIP